MKYTYEQPDYLDVNGARHLVQELKKYIQDIMNGKIDISQYATKDELSSAVSSIDLSGYAKKTDIPSLDGYALKGEIPSLDGYAKTTDIPSVEGLATKSYVDENIAKVATSGDIDLSNYVTKDTVYTKEQTDALIPSVPSKVSQLENDSNYLSSIPEEYVTETELNAKGYLTEHQDLSAYALKTEIPSLDGYATTQYVDNAIANVPSGGNVDLSNYYTKEETNALIPSTEGLATEEYVNNAISNIPTTDLSNYYTKNETYSKTEVDTLVANSGGSSSGGSGGGSAITYAYDTEIATGETYFDGRLIYMRIFHINPLSSAPSNYIVYDNYHSQTPFADKIISAEPVWYTTSSTQNVFTGNVVQAFSSVSGSSGSAAVSAVNNLLKTVAWVQAWQTSSEFAITVTRGQDMYHYACDVFVKYVKSA